ncbi:hypothetical protein GGI15_004124 [Coemansia interrupta]|uniref:Uncharacterized protein n=1 Tax=Coemansia interrupta TaxID=1126814 RepID=A0A9W8HAM4_9FUNG|nr:hypothetical protein GGI15_004124 [Coemansia interrupta]
MRTGAILLSAAAIYGSCILSTAASDSQHGAAVRIPRKHVKLGKIPRDQGVYKRADSTSDNADNTDNADNADTPTPTPTKNTSSSSSSTKSTATPKTSNTKGSKTSTTEEQGDLETDGEDNNSDEGDNNNNNNNNSNDGGDDNNNSNDTADAGVVNDENGNPIVTDANASYWQMITPTGVNYLSGASRMDASLAAGVAMAAAAACAAGLF